MRRIVLPRREFLKGMGATAAAGGFVACNPGESDSDVEAGVIDTFVFVIMENRSFDHYFGSLTLLEGRVDVDGLLATHYNEDADGNKLNPHRMESHCVEPDPPHGWESSRQALDGGTNLGFVAAFERARGTEGRENVMGYLTREELPVSYAFADNYGIADRWFSSVCGPTWPNRLYAHGAQSQGMTTNDLPTGNAYTMPAIWDRLDDAGVPWGYYYTDLPMLALFGRFGTRMNHIEEFFLHAEAGTLPPVVMLEPGAASNDDHPPHHAMLGQLFLSSIHNALAASPHWNRCLLVIFYDEAGGFFDHVPPGKAPDDRAAEGFDQLGFRVPAMIIGPWVKPGFVSEGIYDHTSFLVHLERHFNLEPLTARDAAATDLTDFLDLERMANNQPYPPAELPVIDLTEADILAQCEEVRSRRATGQPEWQDAVHKLGFAHLDRTDDLPKIERFLLDKAIELGVCHGRVR